MTNRGRLSRVAVAGPEDRSRKVCHLIDDRLLLFFLRVVLPIVCSILSVSMGPSSSSAATLAHFSFRPFSDEITPRIDSEAISPGEATSSQAHGNQN
jgi:hypothetical protein